MAANVAFGSQATRSSQIRSGFKRPSSVRFRRDGVGLAPHVEFAIVLMGGAEAEPLVEPFGRRMVHLDQERHAIPGLAMSTSQNRESRERGLQTIKESLFKLDGMALDMGRRIAFIKAYGGFWATSLNLQKKGGIKVLDILDAEHKRLQAEWQASCKRFYEKEEQKRIERAKKAKRVPKTTQGRKARGQKASPPVSSTRSKVALEL